jgi:Fis family transcriptional regulator, factor for inversion stimulation protein
LRLAVYFFGFRALGPRLFKFRLPTALPAERANVKEQLETVIGLMVDRGILLEEAVTDFEKKFIKRALERTEGNQCRAAKVLGIHRNTLSRKIGEYKLNYVGRRKA